MNSKNRNCKILKTNLKNVFKIKNIGIKIAY